MITEYYYDEIIEAVDKAATDRDLTSEQYAELLDRVITDLQFRYESMQNDLKNKS